MGYDDWKTTEPDNRYDQGLSLYDHDDAEAEFPQDEHYKYFAIDPNDDPRTVEYRERVISDLLEDVREFLRFSSVRQLLKLIVGEL